MTQSRLTVGALAIGLVALSGVPLEGQRTQFPLAEGVSHGEGVAPFFDGWYANPDGTFTFSFGYMNRNTEEVVDIPIGENNFIEPAQFNGMQPTHFRPVSYGGFSGRRERGVFAVRIPANFIGDVVWTLRHNGKEYKVPGRIGSPAYEMSYTPQAEGSMMPVVKFALDGEPSKGREGVTTGPLRATVGTPLEIKFWMEDKGEREPRPTNFVWWLHQGPAPVAFEPGTGRAEAGGGEAATQATFTVPGEYLLRVNVNNFGAGDSSFGNNCCWANGYVKVTVTP